MFTRSRLITPLGGLLLLLALTTTAHAAVIAVSSSLDLVARSNSNGAGLVTISDTDTQGVTTATLGTLAIEALSTSRTGSIKTSVSGQASWINTAQGQVVFDDVGWESLNNTGNGFTSLAGTSWSYTFIADVNGLFTLDWDVILDTNNSDNVGLNGFRFSLAGAGGGETLLFSGQSGPTARTIQAGQQYTASIYTNDGLSGGIGTRNAHMDGIFNWSMDSGPAVSSPEPISLVLLTAGLVALGVRRKRLG